jgi:hypothetical protein
LFHGIITSPKGEEALTSARRRFIEYKMVRNDINIISDPNLHEHSTCTILDESLFHVVKNVLNENGAGIIILEWKLEIHPFLENAKKVRPKH